MHWCQGTYEVHMTYPTLLLILPFIWSMLVGRPFQNTFQECYEWMLHKIFSILLHSFTWDPVIGPNWIIIKHNKSSMVCTYVCTYVHPPNNSFWIKMCDPGTLCSSLWCSWNGNHPPSSLAKLAINRLWK
jgi:hypothetical protein